MREGERETEKYIVTEEKGGMEKNRVILSDNGDDDEQGRDVLQLRTIQKSEPAPCRLYESKEHHSSLYRRGALNVAYQHKPGCCPCKTP